MSGWMTWCAPGLGVALWSAAEQPQQLHDALESTGVPLLKAPENAPFGLNSTFADPDGYAVTVHGDVWPGRPEAGRWADQD